MIMIQFREDDHARHMKLLKNIKEDIYALCESMEQSHHSEHDAHGERRYIIDQFDDRPRHHEMDERRGGGRGGRGGGMMGKRGYPEYPEYPIDERGGGRYSY